MSTTILFFRNSNNTVHNFEIDEMIITLVGNSNVGKTHWSIRLEREAGFRRIDVDRIGYGNKLIALLKEELGRTPTIEDAVAWLGQPGTEKYAINCPKLLNWYFEGLRETIDILRVAAEQTKIVVDSGGSLAHAPEEFISELRKLTHVVCLAVSDKRIDKILQSYQVNPKLVTWPMDSYTTKAGESCQAAMERNYRELIRFREKRYRDMATKACGAEWKDRVASDIAVKSIIPFEMHRDPNATVEIIAGRYAYF